MKKAITIILNILIFVGLGAAFATYFYTKHKLGMNRFMVYHTQKLGRLFPLNTVSYVTFTLLTLALFWVLYRSIKFSNPRSRLPIIQGMVAIVVALLSWAYLIFGSYRQNHGFYLSLACLAISLLIAIFLIPLNKQRYAKKK